MGLIILTPVTLGNGLSISNLHCSIRGSYSFNKTPNGYPAPYRIHFTYVLFIPGHENTPLITNNDCIDIETFDNIDYFTQIYNHLKSKFPVNTQFQDN